MLATVKVKTNSKRTDSTRVPMRPKWGRGPDSEPKYGGGVEKLPVAQIRLFALLESVDGLRAISTLGGALFGGFEL